MPSNNPFLHGDEPHEPLTTGGSAAWDSLAGSVPDEGQGSGYPWNSLAEPRPIEPARTLNMYGRLPNLWMSDPEDPSTSALMTMDKLAITTDTNREIEAVPIGEYGRSLVIGLLQDFPEEPPLAKPGAPEAPPFIVILGSFYTEPGFLNGISNELRDAYAEWAHTNLIEYGETISNRASESGAVLAATKGNICSGAAFFYQVAYPLDGRSLPASLMQKIVQNGVLQAEAVDCQLISGATMKLLLLPKPQLSSRLVQLHGTQDDVLHTILRKHIAQS